MSPRFPMGVATTYNLPMSRVNAILLAVFLLGTWPAFSADPPPGTTAAEPSTPFEDDVDPATGLSRSPDVRKLLDPAGNPAPTPGTRAGSNAAPVLAPNARPHI